MDKLLVLALLLSFILASSAALWSTKTYKKQPQVISDILTLVSKNNINGNNSVNKQELASLINSLPKTPVKREMMYGKWNLIYTTEKETNFISKYFGKCTGVYQQIKNDTINNVISFEDKVFSVDGMLFLNNEKTNRVDFKFTKASLTFNNQKPINFPPVGSGYFDNLYIDDLIRISYDVRGDYLISKREI